MSARSTYDSDSYIQYLSYILRAVTGEEPVTWVTREFAVPLGLVLPSSGQPLGENRGQEGSQKARTPKMIPKTGPKIEPK